MWLDMLAVKYYYIFFLVHMIDGSFMVIMVTFIPKQC